MSVALIAAANLANQIYRYLILYSHVLPESGNSLGIWSHSVTCHPAVMMFPSLSLLQSIKLVLDLAIPEGCKAECT